jgi:hypothetical protein
MLIIDPPATAGGTDRFQVRVLTFDAKPSANYKDVQSVLLGKHRRARFCVIEFAFLECAGRKKPACDAFHG